MTFTPVKDVRWSPAEALVVVIDRLNAFAREVTAELNTLVDTSRLADAAVVSDKIADGSVVIAKLARTPGAGMYRSGAAQAIASGALTVVQINTKEFSSGELGEPPTVDTTNFRIAITRAGRYWINARVGTAAPVAPAAASQIGISICVGGLEIASATAAAVASANLALNVGVEWPLSVGSLVDLRMFQSTGSNVSTQTATNTRPSLQLRYVEDL